MKAFVQQACSELPGPPSIHLNSELQLNQSDNVLPAKSAFNISCHGNGSVHLFTTALRLRFGEKLGDVLEVKRAGPRHTGMYGCEYTNKSLGHLTTWIHLFVTDLTQPSTVFVTRRNKPSFKEGDDFLFECLLTDPSVKNLTLQSEDRGRSLPPGMNVTVDPRTGALIRHLRKSFRGTYSCSGWKDGQEFRSQPFDLLVASRPRDPPSLSVSETEVVHLIGEQFQVTCQASNPSHSYSVNWKHPLMQNISITITRYYHHNRHYINSTLKIPAINQTHAGLYSCMAVNEAGVSTATTQLRVLDHPYLVIYLNLQSTPANTRTMLVAEDLMANASSSQVDVQGNQVENISSLEVKGKLIANVSTEETNVNGSRSINISDISRAEMYEGRDMTITFVIEAYPPIRNHYWTTPEHVHLDDYRYIAYQENYTAKGFRMESSLRLRPVLPEDRGRYSFHFSNPFFNGSQHVDLQIFWSPSVAISKTNDSVSCSSSGYPLPKILWLTCPGVQDSCDDGSAHKVSPVTSQEEEEEVRTQLPLSADGDEVTVECVAYNLAGESRRAFVHRPPPHQPVFTPPLIGALTAASALLLLLLVVFYKWRQKPKYEIRWKIIESTDGNSYTFVDPTQLPYNQKWEFPRDKLRLGAVLGSGAFGKVVEATAYGLETDNKATIVAVKMLKPRAHSEEREALMSELKILSHLGYHDNIVNLLGACTRGGPMLMITEYCSHGDLLNFLRATAQDFVASMWSVEEMEKEVSYKNIATPPARLRSDSGISCCSEYQEMQPILNPGHPQQVKQSGNGLSVCDLVKFSCQVAQGLDFLSTRNCIHRDVAARNVLLTDHRVAKICDFGLARDIRNDDSYIVQGNARLPVKWMAPESIFQCIYTVQSDVWSYGVLLWEIFSLGKSPYPNIAVDTNFYKMIKDGRHMAQPDFAPAEIYHLMKLCWSLEPTDRPTFKSIGQLINRLLPSTNDTSTHNSGQLMYKNIDECREEEEEVGGEIPKGEEEEEEQGHRDDHGDREEREPMVKNIYQLS
ncbi:macrophage colony-stimulating factor 1 receptor 2 [Cololabis saira]|uniref:macrophage colony-stimulating factor 1 receptor 2 n=1 Tax=Cololabis saira TaxID=129043 RepID=UPI002AD1FB37|nr:macrophage colony-stimulating factor 1 receptor 2 [Cololabis saira]